MRLDRMDRNIDIWRPHFGCAAAFVRSVRVNIDLDFGIQPILAEWIVVSLGHSRRWIHIGRRQDVRIAADMSCKQYLNLDRITVAIEFDRVVAIVAGTVVSVTNVLLVADSESAYGASAMIEFVVAVFGVVDGTESLTIDRKV